MTRPSLFELKYFKWTTKIFGVSPFENGTYTIVYNSLLLMVILLSFSYEIHGRISTDFEDEIMAGTCGILLGTLNTTVEVVCNVSMVLVLAVHKKFYEKLLKGLDDIDEIIAKYVQTSDKTVGQYADVITLHLFEVTMTCYDLILWMLLNNSSTKYYSFDRLYRYRINIFILVVYVFMKEIRARMTSTNQLLRDAIRRYRLDASGEEGGRNFENVIKNVPKIRAHYAEIVNCFNETFGWPVLWTLANYVFLFLTAFKMGLQVLNGTVRADLSSSFNVWMSGTMISAAVGAVLLTSICDATTKEVRKTGELAYTYYYGLDLHQYNDGPKSLVENLILLIRQTRTNLPTFSAAGFFPINYSTLFILINLLMSYLIVLMQFQ